jgi:hypothetical protein
MFYRLGESRSPGHDRGRACKVVPPSVGLPGVSCDSCGRTWATSLDAIRRVLPVRHPLRDRRPTPVSPAELEAIIADLRAVLELPDSLQVRPGTRIDRLRLRCMRSDVEDLQSPALHTFVITERLHRCLVDAALTGWHVEDLASVTSEVMTDPLPGLHELVIEGKAGPALTEPPVEVVEACERCGYVEYSRPVLSRLDLDAEAWDGSDLMRFDPPFHGYCIVTERVKEAFASEAITGCELTPLEELCRQLAERERESQKWAAYRRGRT